MNPAALDRFVRDRVDRFLSWAGRRLGRLALVFGSLLALVLALTFVGPEHGLEGRFFAGLDLTGPPVSTRVDRVLNLSADVLAERSNDAAERSAAWAGYVYAPKRSTYRFSVQAGGRVRVRVGGEVIVDSEAPPPGRFEREMELVRGSHPVRIEFSGDGGLDLRWRETRTPRWRMPRLPLYRRPVGFVPFVWDVVRDNLAPAVKTAARVFGVLLILGLARTARPRRETLSVLALAGFVLLALAYEAEVFSKRATAVSGCDPFAYLQAAELMARDGLFKTEYVDPLAAEVIASYRARPGAGQLTFIFAPLGYYLYDFDHGLVYNVFPPGLPLLLYPAVRLFGRAPVFHLLPALNVLLLVLLFLLGTRASGAGFGLVLAAVTFFNFPVFENSLLIMSDLPSLGLLGLSAFFVYRGLPSGRLWLLAAAGGAFGLAFLVRYSNLIAAVPLAALFWWTGRQGRVRVAAPAGLFAAAAVLAGGLPLALYTHRLFGTVFRLVYEPISQSRVDPGNFVSGVAYYGTSLLRTFGPLTLLVALVGAAGGILRPGRRPAVLVCLLALAVFFGFFALHSIQNERYLLPVYPCLGLLAGWGAVDILNRLGRSFLASLLVLVLLGAAPLLRSRQGFRGGERLAEETAKALAAKVPAEAVVFCEEMSGSLRFYAGLSGYRFLPAEGPVLLETAAILAAKMRPVFFLLDGPAAEERFRRLRDEHPDFDAGLEDRGRVRGRPLFRYSPPVQEQGIPVR